MIGSKQKIYLVKTKIIIEARDCANEWLQKGWSDDMDWTRKEDK